MKPGRARRARGAATQPCAAFKQQQTRITAELQPDFIVSLVQSIETHGTGYDQKKHYDPPDSAGCCWPSPAFAAEKRL